MAIGTAHIIDECYSNLEYKVADGNMVAKYNLFLIEVLKAWPPTCNRDRQFSAGERNYDLK